MIIMTLVHRSEWEVLMIEAFLNAPMRKPGDAKEKEK